VKKTRKRLLFLDTGRIQNQNIQDEFVEFEEVYTDKYYGTLKSEVERIWKEGKVVIFDVDVKGGIRLKEIFGDKALSIFVMPPSIAELEQRLIKRNTDCAETIKTRVEKAGEEMTYQKHFDKIIVNTDLNRQKWKSRKLLITLSTNKNLKNT
jgi:guanylate kinase